jgi:hypothetical protein
MSARVDTTGDVLQWAPPARVLEKAYAFDSEGLHQFDVSLDGRRFLMMKAYSARSAITGDTLVARRAGTALASSATSSSAAATATNVIGSFGRTS